MSIQKLDVRLDEEQLDGSIKSLVDRLFEGSPRKNLRQRILATARQRNAEKSHIFSSPARMLWMPDNHMVERRATMMLSAIRSMTNPMMFTIR